MLLRRITEHVKAQNWTAVALDFVIVVVGVFVGIQVSNWNASRADDARATAYLERIHADLVTDVATYQSRMDIWRAVSGYGTTALSYANTGQVGDLTHWEILLAFFQGSQVAEFNTTQTTFDELTSAGEQGLIANVDIRTAISVYYSNVGNATLSERPAYREHVRGVIPVAVQSYIWENCYSSDGYGKQAMFACDAPIDPQRAAEIVNGIAANDDLIGELRYWMSTMKVASLIGDDRIELANGMLQLIEEELGIEREEPAP